MVVDTETGLAANFISRADLIKAKLAANRPQDVADVRALQEASDVSPAIPKPPKRKAKPKKKPAAKP